MATEIGVVLVGILATQTIDLTDPADSTDPLDFSY
jgi:hypothetical protein